MAEPTNIPPVGEQRRPGMDHPHHAFRTLTEAPRFAWPDDARIAFTVTLVLDYWELDPSQDANPDPRMVSPLGKFFPDWLSWSQREYGARVGIFRVLDVLDRYQVRAGVAVNALAAERYPYLIEQFKKRNYEFIGHGSSANRMITSAMSEAEEQAEIAGAVAALEQLEQLDEVLLDLDLSFRGQVKLVRFELRDDLAEAVVEQPLAALGEGLPQERGLLGIGLGEGIHRPQQQDENDRAENQRHGYLSCSRSLIAAAEWRACRSASACMPPAA